ncbi:C9orf114 family protein [Megaselia abdita]
MKAIEKPIQKSWKKINQEKKEFKKKKQKEKLIKQLEQAKKLEELQQEKQEEEKILPVSTVSIAVPGSILENAQSPELRSYLAGQIARAACIFKIDEVIVFDDHTEVSRPKANKMKQDEGK